MGISESTRTHTRGDPYPQTHGFTRQNKPKITYNGQEMSEIWPNLVNFANLAVSHSFLGHFGSSWARFKCHGYGKAYPYPYPRVPIPVTRAGMTYPCYSLAASGYV